MQRAKKRHKRCRVAMEIPKRVRRDSGRLLEALFIKKRLNCKNRLPHPQIHQPKYQELGCGVKQEFSQLNSRQELLS